MPPLSRWFIRAALVHLVLGFTVGALMLGSRALPAVRFAWWLLPAHIDLLLVGWTAQLTMGVAFWILPRFAGGTTRGNAAAAWAAFVLINAGVALAGLGPLEPRLPWAPLLGRAAEAAGAVAFGAHAWFRVKRPSVDAAP
jgi:hypothetical protein